MKHISSLLIALLLCLTGTLSSPIPARADIDLSLFELSAEIAVYSISEERFIRSCGETADLSALGADEYYTYILDLKYTGSQPLAIDSFTVSVDGSEQWGWSTRSLDPDTLISFHIYYSNMQSRMTEGMHTVTWYVSGQPIFTKSFTFVNPMDWNSVFPIPSSSDIDAANQTATVRSPYLYGWLDMNREYRFTEYSVDFKADHLPKATYCCLTNMRMDLSPLKKLYSSVHTDYESVNMYAGFQRRWSEYCSILSFWDIFCTDANGNQQTIRAQRLYPSEVIGNDDFSGEGTGAHTLVPYEWEEDHWYRMLLQCSDSPETGTTLVEQWVCDLETGVWTLLCRYDTGIPDSCFTGPVAIFLENFDPDHAGEIRSMEVANIRLRDADTRQWKTISNISIGSNGGLPSYEGSYAYGAQGNRFWMITSGVGGDWYAEGHIPQNKAFSVTGVQASSPY